MTSPVICKGRMCVFGMCVCMFVLVGGRPYPQVDCVCVRAGPAIASLSKRDIGQGISRGLRRSKLDWKS